MTVHQTDVAIIGAGPVGLFAVFEAGMLGLRCHVLECVRVYYAPNSPRQRASEIPHRISVRL